VKGKIPVGRIRSQETFDRVHTVIPLRVRDKFSLTGTRC